MNWHKQKEEIYFLFCTSSIWGSELHWLDKFLVYTVNDRNIVFSGTPFTCYLLSFGNLIVNPVHFLLTENIKRDNQGIIIYIFVILLFNSKYKRRWINVIFLQYKHNINAVSYNIKLEWNGTKLGKGSVNLAFIPIFKLQAHKLYIWRHCTNIVYIC